MKRCIVTIRRPGARPFHFAGLYPSTFDAVIHGMTLATGENVRVSAKVLP